MGRRKDHFPERGPVRRGKPLTAFRFPDPFRTPGRRLFVRIAAVVIFAAALLYALFAPPRFPLGDEYLFSPADGSLRESMIIEPGGRILLGPSDIRLWGRYPVVYGLEKGGEGERRFLLDMKDHSFRLFPSKEEPDEAEFGQILQKNDLRMEDVVSLGELIRGPRETRMRLKALLGKR